MKANSRKRWTRYGLSSLALILAFVILAGCENKSKTSRSGHSSSLSADGSVRLKVFTGILPIAGLVERLGGDFVDVNVLVQPGQDPHSFQATPSQLEALIKSKVFFQVGVPFEQAIAKKIAALESGVKIVKLTEAFTQQRVSDPVDHYQTHSHDLESGISSDPHVWLAPDNLKFIAMMISRVLIETDPIHASDYVTYLDSFTNEVDAIDGKIRTGLSAFPGRSFYVFHPAFGYFADSYGLIQVAVETGGQAPTAKRIKTLITRAKADGVRVILVQPQFNSRSAKKIAKAINGVVTPVDPLGKDPLQTISDLAQILLKIYGGDQ